MNKCFVDDYERTFSHKYHLFPCVIRMIRNHELRVLFWLRQYQFGSRIKREFIKHILWHYRRKYGIELPYNPNIAPGSGLRLIHPWNITVNANAILGKNVTLFKGCTIGEILGGAKKDAQL